MRPGLPVVRPRPFEIICEIEPPVRPDLTHTRDQIGVLTEVSSTFLIPDNHIGRATVSSIAVAHEVQAMGGHSIACINSRDRNLLGFRRDLLTAAAYGVSQFLFVYGDSRARAGGQRADGPLMIEEARSCTATDPAFAGVPPWRIGVGAGLQPLPRWKHAADFIFGQVSFSADAQLRWRDANPAGVPVYAGVMVLASAAMARRLAAAIPDTRSPAAASRTTARMAPSARGARPAGSRNGTAARRSRPPRSRSAPQVADSSGRQQQQCGEDQRVRIDHPLWVIASPDSHDMLVRQAGYSYDEYERWVRTTVEAAVLS